MIDAFHGADIAILVQEFIKEAEGTDIRAFVVGRKVMATMERKGAKGDFRSNLHRGGTSSKVDPDAGRARHGAEGGDAPWDSTWQASTCCARRTGRW